MTSNGSPVSNATLNDKLDLLRAEQRAEHIATRAVAGKELDVFRADQRTEHIKTRVFSFVAVGFGIAGSQAPELGLAVAAFVWPF